MHFNALYFRNERAEQLCCAAVRSAKNHYNVCTCLGNDHHRGHLSRLSDSGVRQPAGLRDRSRGHVWHALLLLLSLQQYHRLRKLGRQLRRLLRLSAPVSTAPQGVLWMCRTNGHQPAGTERTDTSQLQEPWPPNMKTSITNQLTKSHSSNRHMKFGLVQLSPERGNAASR